MKKNLKYLSTVKEPACFIKGFRDPQVTSFVKSILDRNYHRFFKSNQEQASQLITETFGILEEAAEKDSGLLNIFEKAVEKVVFDVFHADEKDFWFHDRYNYYKSVVKPESMLQLLEPRLEGKRILDFGTGRGFFAKLVSLRGYEVCTTDVIDQLSEDVADLEFRLMPDEVTIPYETGEFDTVIIKTVLHHIDKNNLELILQELNRVGSKLVIIEDVPFCNGIIHSISDKVDADNDPLMHEFLFDLDWEQKLDACKIIDYYGNALAQGLYYINFPFNFQTLAGWKLLAEKAGLEFTEHYPIGFFERGLHTYFQTVLVLNGE